MKKSLVVIALLLTSVLSAQSNFLSGKYLLTVQPGATVTFSDFETIGIGFTGKLSGEYHFNCQETHIFGIKAFGGFTTLGATDERTIFEEKEFSASDIYFGGGLTYTYDFTDSFIPYLMLGASYHSLSGTKDTKTNVSNDYSGTSVALNAELGFHIPLSNDITLNVSGFTSFANDEIDNHVGGSADDLLYSGLVGLSFAFDGPEGDCDGDGVGNNSDQCPDTPEGIRVDATGCTADTDKDGIADSYDKCPSTPAGVKVTSDGCPVDNDGDGVADYLDKCPGTESGVAVTSDGCPVDTDGDGVADYLDKCADTPTGVAVTADGCPKDSDNDGVADYLDKCPNTPTGVEVTSDGCAKEKEIEKPVEQKEQKEYVPVTPVVKAVTIIVMFESDGTTISAEGKANLDKLVRYINKYPEANWDLESHTDNTGGIFHNIKLSANRAKVVLNYLAAKGIDKNKFTVTSFGPAKPIGDNSSPEGRALNRRVEIFRK